MAVRLTRLILLVYLASSVCAVLIVPWSYVQGNIRFDTEYAFLLAEMQPRTIDYGLISLELVALTGLAGIAFLLRDQLKGLETSVSNFQERIASSLSRARTSWDRYWREELRVFRWRLSRSAIFWRIGLLIFLGNALADLLGVDATRRGWWSLIATMLLLGHFL